MSRRRHGIALALATLVLAACSGGGGGSGGKSASGPPIVLGMINMEDSPVGSFPEARRDAAAAVRYINEELGGVRGRPIRLEVCTTRGTPESSQACANKLRAKKPVAVVGGFDLAAASSLDVLEKAGIPYVGGSPALGDELTSTGAFMLSGGAAADLLGQAKYATDTLHVTRVGVIYIDLPGLLTAAVEGARQVLRKKGVTDVKLVAEPADSADFTVALEEVNRSNPDLIVAVFPAQGCARIMQAKQALKIKAKMLYPGTCADQAVFDAAGAGANDAYFASGYLPFGDTSNPEVATYLEQRRKFGPGNTKPSVLSQAAFSVVMNLRQLLLELDGDPTPATLTAKLKATRDHPSFMGHPFTCDGAQVLLLVAVCDADVRLLQYRDGRFTDVVGNWVNGADLVRLFTG